MNELMTNEAKVVEVRGRRVMLDRDVADALGVSTSELNKNSNRSPKWEYLREQRIEDQYRFQLTDEEAERLRFHKATAGSSSLRANPTAYTKKGCAYFGTSMENPLACQMAVELVDVFDAKTSTIGSPQGEDSLEMIAHSMEQNLKLCRDMIAYRREQAAQRATLAFHEVRIEGAEHGVKSLAARIDNIQKRKLSKSIAPPPGTVSADQIRQRYMPGVSQENIRELLTMYNHPSQQFMFETDDGDLGKIIPMFLETGIPDLVERIFTDSVFIKRQPANYLLRHPKMQNNFRVKLLEASPWIHELVKKIMPKDEQ